MLRALVAAFFLLASMEAQASKSLFEAARDGNTASIERLLKSGAAVDSRARDQATPLIEAALAGQSAAAELLLAKGADVMGRNSGGFTPLHAAAYSGSVPIAEILLGKGAALEDAANKAGTTPLFVAGEENRIEVAEFLIARGANVNHPESHGYLPTTRVLWKGHKDMLRLLRRHGAECQPPPVTTDEDHKACLEVK